MAADGELVRADQDQTIVSQPEASPITKMYVAMLTLDARHNPNAQTAIDRLIQTGQCSQELADRYRLLREEIDRERQQLTWDS